MPILIANASRPDGSHLLVEIFATSQAEPPEELATELVSDRLVGWQTSRTNNLVGEELPDFGRLRVRSETVRVDGPHRGASKHASVQ